MNYVGMTIIRDCTTYDENGDPVSTPELTFKWQLGEAGELKTETPVELSTGRYQVSFVVEDKAGGTVFYRWDTDGDTDVAKEGRLFIKPSVFEM